MRERAAEVLTQSRADLAREGLRLTQSVLERVGGVGEPERLQLRRLAARVLAEQHEVARIGDQHQAVVIPVLAHLVAVGREPRVVRSGLDLDDTAIGALTLARLALLDLLAGVEPEVGMSGTLRGEPADGEYLRPQRAADRVEQVGERRVVGELASRAAGRADLAQVGQVVLDHPGQPGVGGGHGRNVAAPTGEAQARVSRGRDCLTPTSAATAPGAATPRATAR